MKKQGWNLHLNWYLQQFGPIVAKNAS